MKRFKSGFRWKEVQTMTVIFAALASFSSVSNPQTSPFANGAVGFIGFLMGSLFAAFMMALFFESIAAVIRMFTK